MYKRCRCGQYMGIVEPEDKPGTVRCFCQNCRRKYLPRIERGQTMTFVTGVAGFTAVTFDRRTI